MVSDTWYLTSAALILQLGMVVSGLGCVILDLTMPHMNGEETFKELQRLKRNVRVILSSGYSETDISPRFAGMGLAGYLHKPYNRATMREAVSGALRCRTDQDS